MNNKKFKVGIVGCGTIAPYHVEAFQTLENVEVVGVSDVNEMKAKELCSKYNINFWTTDYRKLHDLIIILHFQFNSSRPFVCFGFTRPQTPFFIIRSKPLDFTIGTAACS